MPSLIPQSRFRLALLAGLLLVVAVLVFYGYRHFHAADFCAGTDREMLYSSYPSLRDLAERQQRETERLLARHRAEDIAVNQELGEEGLTSEEALRMSVNQVEEIAALRREHRAAFERLCRDLAGR